MCRKNVSDSTKYSGNFHIFAESHYKISGVRNEVVFKFQLTGYNWMIPFRAKYHRHTGIFFQRERLTTFKPKHFHKLTKFLPNNRVQSMGHSIH